MKDISEYMDEGMRRYYMEVKNKVDNSIVYFELNNWFAGTDYPNTEPYLSWLRNDFNISFNNEKWVKENGLCVLHSMIDMASNYCITAKREWVEKNCPSLLTEYTQFLREADEDGYVTGQFGDEFLEYAPENIGITYVVDDEYEDDCEEDDD